MTPLSAIDVRRLMRIRVASASDTAAKAADGISPVISRAQKKANGDIRIVMQAIAAPSQEPLLSTIVPTARAVITIVLTVSICAALILWLKSANDNRISSSHSGGWEMKIARYGAWPAASIRADSR